MKLGFWFWLCVKRQLKKPVFWMQFMILPLSYRTKEEKAQKAAEMAELAEQIQEREQQLFVMAGLLVFADKIIDMATAN